MGQVWQATDTQLNLDLALKVQPQGSTPKRSDQWVRSKD